jgi:hypothetical protein
MGVPVLRILRGQGRISNDQQVLRVLLLRWLGIVEAAGEDRLAIDDDDLVVGNGRVGVDQDWHALIGEEVCGGILLLSPHTALHLLVSLSLAVMTGYAKCPEVLGHIGIDWPFEPSHRPNMIYLGCGCRYFDSTE